MYRPQFTYPTPPEFDDKDSAFDPESEIAWAPPEGGELESQSIMSVYVDDFEAEFHGMIMCHMMADSTIELLEMADRIGVQRKWLQKEGSRYEHFDICKSKRALAIRHGAIEVSAVQLARLITEGAKPESAQASLLFMVS